MVFLSFIVTFEYIKLFLGANMNIDKMIKNCDNKKIRYLLEKNNENRKFDEIVTEYFFHKIYSGDIEIVEKMLESGFNVDVEDKFGNTPIFYVVQKPKNIEMFELLFKYGADLEHRNKKGETPIFYAMSWVKGFKKIDFVSKLIEKKVNINCANKNGVTPFMKACCCDDLDWIMAFLKAKVNINCQDKNGRTALMYAIKFGKHEGGMVVEERLISSGAKIDLKDNDGKTALDYAEARNLKNVCKLLKDNQKINKIGREKE